MNADAIQRQDVINELFSSSFYNILNLEEKSLSNRLTQDLSISEIHTIVAVGYSEQNPMKVVANRLGVTMATLNTSINRLVRKGYVKRQRGLVDHRNVLVSLTKNGKKAFRVHRMFHKKMIKNVLNTLSEKEQEILSSALVHVNDYFGAMARKFSSPKDKQ